MHKVKLSELVIDSELVKLRPVNTFVVSRYRQAYRSGAAMPPIIVEKGTNKIVSGNHRYTALVDEYGDDHTIECVVREYKTRRDMLEEFTRENVKHGNPLEGFSQRAISSALLREGMTVEEIAQLFNVSAKRIEDWAGLTVMVIGKKSKKLIAQPMKRGPDIVGETITAEQYDEHVAHDRSISAYAQAKQLTRWLVNGWIQDHKSIQALIELRDEIDRANLEGVA